MDKMITDLLKAAEAKGASPHGLKWLKDVKSITEINDTHTIRWEYMRWAWDNLPAWRARLMPTPEQYAAGLKDANWMVREAWAQRTDINPTPEQYEAGLADEDGGVRQAWAKRTDLTPTPEQYAAGLADEHYLVQKAWARRKREEKA